MRYAELDEPLSPGPQCTAVGGGPGRVVQAGALVAERTGAVARELNAAEADGLAATGKSRMRADVLGVSA
jgi:hypothetical protein